MTCSGNQVDPGGLGPDFIGGVKNVTVPEGRDVILSCTVVRLGTHKVQGVPKKARVLRELPGHITSVFHGTLYRDEQLISDSDMMCAGCLDPL